MQNGIPSTQINSCKTVFGRNLHSSYMQERNTTTNFIAQFKYVSSVALITPHPTPSTPPPSAPKQVEIAVSAFCTRKYWPTLALIKPPAAFWYFFCTPGTWDKHPRPKNIKSERSDFSPNHWTSTLINFGRKKPFLSDFAFYAMNRKVWYKETGSCPLLLNRHHISPVIATFYPSCMGCGHTIHSSLDPIRVI